jgi:hypothetical protein
MLKNTPEWARGFKETMETEFKKNYDPLMKRAEESVVNDGITETSRIYRMTLKYAFGSAVEKMKSLKK